jgi:hypothetical protein
MTRTDYVISLQRLASQADRNKKSASHSTTYSSELALRLACLAQRQYVNQQT